MVVELRLSIVATFQLCLNRSTIHGRRARIAFTHVSSASISPLSSRASGIGARAAKLYLANLPPKHGGIRNSRIRGHGRRTRTHQPRPAERQLVTESLVSFDDRRNRRVVDSMIAGHAPLQLPFAPKPFRRELFSSLVSRAERTS